MQKLKHRIMFDWHFLVVALATTMAGANFLLNPGLMDDSSTYAFLASVVDDSVFAVPGEDLLFPRFDYTLGIWVEDKDSIIVYMKKQIDELDIKVSDIEKNQLNKN